METEKHRVLVAGATGYLGGYLVRELKRRGRWVRALVRRREQQERLREEVDDVWLGQVTEPETLVGITDGIDHVYSALGITRQKDGATYEEVDYGGNRALLTEALKSSVRQFLYVSVFRGEEMRDVAVVDAKERFVDELCDSPVESVIIRPTGFFSDFEEFLTMAQRGRVWLFGDGNQRVNPIAGDDLARVCVEAIEEKEKVVEVGGPEVFTLDEIAHAAFDALEESASIWHLPLWLATALRSGLRWFTPVTFYGPLEFFLVVSGESMVAPRRGERDLREHFRQQMSGRAESASADQSSPDSSPPRGNGR